MCEGRKEGDCDLRERLRKREGNVVSCHNQTSNRNRQSKQIISCHHKTAIQRRHE